MTKPKKPPENDPLAPGTPFAHAADQARALAGAHAELDLTEDPTVVDGMLCVRFAVDVSSLPDGPGGFDMADHEEIVLVIGDTYPRLPPKVGVPHERWLGEPHVLGGSTLCIYLDQDREWDPALGVGGVLSRTWEFLADAKAGKFDAATSMFHALGGIQHIKVQSPTVTVRRLPAELGPGIHPIAWVERSATRIDIAGWHRRPGADEKPGIAILLTSPLPKGAGKNLKDLLGYIDHPVHRAGEHLLPRRGFPSADSVQYRLRHAATTAGPDGAVLVVVAAPNLAVAGPGRYDLVAMILTSSEINDACQVPDVVENPRDPEAVDKSTLNLPWLRVDDTRPEISTRRDDRRPVEWFQGKSVELWGCGALGSWTAELIVRAGAQHILLRDWASVTSGLLVRQNYRELDIGHLKAEALADRLRSLSDSVTVEVGVNGGVGAASQCLGSADLLVDATVSVSAAAALDYALQHHPAPVQIAQVATDTATATLGIINLVPGDAGVPITQIDELVRKRVEGDHVLEPYRAFWDSNDDVLFAPARGCSTPTFRGSAADAMGIAATAVSLIGPAAANQLSGGFLFALPHSHAGGTGRVWVNGGTGPRQSRGDRRQL